ncbi:interferon-induced protein 44-like [Oryzias latipes]|uniref:TLDc domain-containing protein n=1 Tax=Oryzias latipes TaxID=8090 RepID=H2L502_ORYLA|nr:interferon-induced protein 44-like [Oryzias latipes]
MNSKLTETQQKAICSQLGNFKLILLYKASIHGFTGAAFHQHCDNKSSTVSVGYNKSGHVFGGYTSQPFSQSRQFVNDNQAFLFSFSEEKLNTYPVTNAPYAVKMDMNSGPNFGNTLILVYKNQKKVYSNPGSFGGHLHSKYYNFTAEKMHGNDLDLTECEVYQVEESFQFENPWRTLNWNSEQKKTLMERIESYKPSISSVSEARVLLVGPVGAGKSSFFNSFKSIFKGHITSQATPGTSSTSVTTLFRSYSVTPGREGKSLPLVFCDTMGLEAEEKAGLNIAEISNIINGHIPDRYQFNSSVPLQSEAQAFRKNPELKDKIHCVAYVIDASKISIMSQNMEDKLKAIRKTVNSSGITQLVLLTKIDEVCPLVKEDITNVYKSIYIKELMQEASIRVGVPLFCVVPVKNYSEVLRLDTTIDILLLSAVDQMLNLVDDFFDEHRE